MNKKTYYKPEVSNEELEKALVEANNHLWEANQKLAKQEKARSELFSNLSHDLRAPVSALLGSVEYLKTMQKVVPPECMDVYDLMERRLANLQTMIQDLFLLAIVESPSVSFHYQKVPIRDLLEEYFYSCEADDSYKNRQLKLSLPEDMECEVEVDIDKLIRVLDNLMSNALRYSGDQDEIHLKATYIRPRHEVQISISDTGIGIAQEDLEHIFEYSYRVNRARTPGLGGSGLGLGIAKGIVERHGGRIQCESKLQEGSCFSFILPCI